MQRSKHGRSRNVIANDIVQVPIDDLSNQISTSLNSSISGSSGYFKFKLEYLRDNFLSKFNDGTGDDSYLRSAAYDSFVQGEQTCADINSRGLSSPQYAGTIEAARRITSSILGPFSYAKVLKGCKHGSGATAFRSRAFGNAVYKYYKPAEPFSYYSRKRRRSLSAPKYLTCTPLALRYWDAFLKAFPMMQEVYGDNNVHLKRGNTLDFVPKNNRTHRTIAKECDVNMFLQLGVGEYFASRLTLLGNSKYDQSRNQELARQGSMYGHLATLDLSRASDSLSWKLVEKLLPNDWFRYLDDIRSHYYLDPFNNEWKEYSKFSTMGNGFTFELQTILFYALSLASSHVGLKDDRQYFSTYGDDIICPTSCARAVSETLIYVGFELNADKSFITGPFRESCGKHYYHGRDVTPFYIRKPIDSIERLIWLLNAIRRWSFEPSMGICNPVLEDLYFNISRCYRIILKHLGGGSDLMSNSQVVNPRTPSHTLARKVSKIAICDSAAYVCKMSQGLELKLPPLTTFVDVNGKVLRDFELYHYLIHPEGSTIPEFKLLKLRFAQERLPIPMFLTELGM
jgi:hypothetical protein